MDSSNSTRGPAAPSGAPVAHDEATLLRLLADAAREFAIFATDLDGVILTWNPGVRNITGYDEGEFVGRDCAMLFTPEDREVGAPEREREVARRDGQALDERWHLKKDGSRFWGSGYMHALYDEAGDLKGFAKILRDQTGEKRAGEEMEARVAERTAALSERTEALAAALLSLERAQAEQRGLRGRTIAAQEAERRHVSRELHDGTGQYLAAIALELGALEEAAARTRAASAAAARTAEAAASAAAEAARSAATLATAAVLMAAPEDAARAASEASETARAAAMSAADAAMAAAAAAGGVTAADEAAPRLSRLRGLAASLTRDVHRLAVGLRPTALDDIGLPGALETLAEEWSERSREARGPAADFQAVGFAPGTARLPADVETVIYRVVQEALTNVARHAVPAGATRVSVLLHRRDHAEVLASVEDDGPGFDLGEAARRGRLGLAGMRERAEIAGGTLEVESEPGRGTTVYLRVPLERRGSTPPPGEHEERSET
ncbi:MAG TPA: ATP-binding protein [Armatimonadaceae bacterium]|nr:ATP-binding protein [Armatimonadaceae bacterium]